jgi:hypothetical protein
LLVPSTNQIKNIPFNHDCLINLRYIWQIFLGPGWKFRRNNV